MSRIAAVLKLAKAPGDKLTVIMIAGSGVLTQFLTLVSGVLGARMLGVEGRGQVVLVAAVSQMAAQLTLGGSLPNAITKELAAHGLRARDGLRGMVGRWIGWALLGGAAAAAYFVLAVDGDVDAYVVALAVGTAVMALLSMTSRILVGAMLGEHANPLAIAMTGVLPQAFAVLVLGVGTALDAGWNAVEIIVVMVVCQGLILLTRFRTLAPAERPGEPGLDRREVARIARQSHIGSIGPLDGLGLDKVLVGSMIGTFAAGLYSTAVAFGSLAVMLGYTVAMVALPKLAAAQVADRDAERAIVRKWMLASAMVLIPTVIVFEIATPIAIPLLFGDDFSDAVPCAYWYVAASGLLGFRRILIATLQARGRGGVASWIELALTPFVVLAIYVAGQADDVAAIGIGMLGIAVVAVAALGVAVLRLEPSALVTRAEAADQDVDQDAGEASPAVEPV